MSHAQEIINNTLTMLSVMVTVMKNKTLRVTLLFS